MHRFATLSLAALSGALAFAQPAAAESRAMRAWTVFFDYGRDALSAPARGVLDKAGKEYYRGGQAVVIVAGHTDRSGSEDSNVALSQRMAVAVRDYLISRGVPNGAIRTEAFGESRPLIETADGVREPQNRRVEVTFGPGSGW